MKCTICEANLNPANSRHGFKHTVTDSNLEVFKKVKSKVKKGDKLEFCDDCYRREFPAAAIRLGAPSSTEEINKLLAKKAEREKKNKDAADFIT